MKKTILILALIISLSSCKKHDANGKLIVFEELYKANWLLGNWEKTDSLGTLQEIWKIQNDSTLIGKSYYIQNKKDTIHNETIELMQNGKLLIYSATIIGENNNEPVAFQLTKDYDSLLVFENPKHDYPQKITYQLKKDKSILATVSGKLKGKPSSENYPMIKIN